VLHSERFIDQAPQEVYAALWDEGQYLCSIRSSRFPLCLSGFTEFHSNSLRIPFLLQLHTSWVDGALVCTIPRCGGFLQTAARKKIYRKKFYLIFKDLMDRTSSNTNFLNRSPGR
jgi:hypothetical protein